MSKLGIEVEPAMTPQQAKYSKAHASPLALYRELAVGDQSFFHLLYYEAVTLILANLPGVLGLGLRSLLYRPLFGKCGGRPAIGKGVTLRHPRNISLGRGLLLDDYSALDIRGQGGAIIIGDNVSIGRFSNIVAKEGSVHLGSGVNIGSFCRIATQSKVVVGDSTLIAAYTYIGPGNHQQGDSGIPLIARDMEIKGGVKIGSHVWIGARSTILDGVTIGENAIIGAHSLVKEDVPPRSVVVGCPAKVVKMLP